ncbi:MAG TPA: heavy-metal-associated domain-containing protein [Anaerolineales bacterium]|nr:heavy-metal-associated domain-containing protein [Anaerolineales bacterium]
MKTKTFETPALYGDHHVTEVRRILMEVEGVADVYASSAFQVIEVTYDESKINDLQIAAKLDEAGYLGEWTIPVEMGTAAQQGDGQKPFFRHTATYETIKHTVSFAQQVSYQGRPLWHCPGIGAVRMDDEVKNG